MTDIDDLLEELTVPRPQGPAAAPAGNHRTRRWWLALGALAAVLVVAGAAATVRGDSGGGSPSPPEEAVTASTLGSAPTSITADANTPVSPTATAASPAPTDTAAEENDLGAARYAVAAGGQVVLRGEAPDRAAADRLVTALTAASGLPVIDELRIVDGAPATTAVPVYFTERILFGFNSIEVAAADLWQLDLAARLLAAQPDLTLRVVAHTDAAGSDDQNLEVAEQRAMAVCNYLVSIGAAPTQIELDPVGEIDEAHDAADDHDADTDRNVELVLHGSLTG